MTTLEVCFWILATCVLYPYLVYPLLLILGQRFAAWPTRKSAPSVRSFSIVIAGYNESASIERRLRELAGLAANCEAVSEIIFVSDGSEDDTAARARRVEGVRVLERLEHRGKAVALTEGCAVATHEVLVFADVRQTWDPQALEMLLDNFRDPDVGAVSGDLLLEGNNGALAGVGLYWRYEKALRKLESQLHSTVGVTGAICAVRRELFHGVPEGTILDDVYWPLQVVMQGKRVRHEARAHAYDRLPPRPAAEFRRKVRTLSGSFQLATRVPALLLPGRNPVWFQFVSHKLLRLAVPWALLGIFALSLMLPGPVYGVLLIGQVAFYGVAVLGLLRAGGGRLASAAASFVLLNAAAWAAFWVWLKGGAQHSWNKTVYQAPTFATPIGRSAVSIPK